MRKLIITTICMITFICGFPQGRSKPGKYVERYDLPYYILTYDDGRVFKKGIVKMYVDIEDGCNAIYLQWHDTGNIVTPDEHIYHEYFFDSPPPLVYHDYEDEITIKTGEKVTINDVYTIYWGSQQYIFYKYPDSANTYKIERLYKEGNKYVRGKDSFTCTLFDSEQVALNVARVFKEAQKRHAIRLITN